MVVQKFGGSSVADGERIRTVAEIILNTSKETRTTVVLSAMKGVTNLLLEGADSALKGSAQYLDILATLEEKHLTAIHQLFGDSERKVPLIERVLASLADLKDIYHGVELVKECSLRSFDLITGFGERLSTAVMAAYLNFRGHKAQAFDTSQNIIISDDNHGQAQVFFDQSYTNIRKTIGAYEGIPVITGFVAVSHTGQPTTLGRNGSDFTASIIGAGLGADKVEIWTDVDGVLSGDPRIINNTFVIDELSVEEAMELSYFGAEVIHPSTMLPVVEKDIPLWIKNTHNPSARGTLIARKIQPHEREITGVASIPGAALLNIEGGGMIGIPGFASRVFSALAKAKVNIIMISQASSEHSICVVIRQHELTKALSCLEAELSTELKQRRIQAISVKKDLEIIAVIGENMRGRPGLSGKLFSALGQKNINILVIVQGSSERNISFVIQESEKALALNTVHQAFLG
jgi:aspartokinase/homoserine dehydrogenase 1